MTVSRRSILQGGAAGFGFLALGGLVGCSTAAPQTGSTPTSGGSAAAETTNLILWTWPEGFGEKALAAVASEFPQYKLRQDVIGGDFKQKLTTTFTAGSGLPDITGVKGEDIAFFKSQAKFFVDLNTVGAADIKGDYLEYKWNQATAADGKQLGIPIDVGPTALFYRFDIFEEAGLPSDPEELAASIRTWDEYIELGKKLLAAKPDTYLIRNAGGLFDVAWAQTGKGFIDEAGVFIGDQEHIRNAWDTAVKALDAGIVATLQSNSADTAAAVNEGRLPADFGASWHLSDLMVDAPETAGKWHVCEHPGEAYNNGGSFLAIPEGAADPAKSFEVIKFLLNAQNQAYEFEDKGNFPATPASFEMPEVAGPVEFLGGQVAAEVFGKAAETILPRFEDPNEGTVNAPFYAEMDLVESSGKDPNKAWDDAVTAAKRLAQQVGLTVK
ncbi:extracellular solute-binding protein [Tessaracoccus sp. Y36]|uniref:extracellular solute-binding protein n=1 Tax=Tessaracoccus sp. ZS01 TaxID=1906324 RepID=UPI00096F60EA|nr:extracellular solute-binding protein [Tessaracoccus sp. ZS01]MCG6567723.1 sugar-binding protein [Tessaracoccus sp. ZS01]OMG55791.1 sugar-binding protein [Tessaracoccus sp. ZS01]